MRNKVLLQSLLHSQKAQFFKSLHIANFARLFHKSKHRRYRNSRVGIVAYYRNKTF
jgi:hypothetical protein